MQWTPERDALLRAFRLDGYSFGLCLQKFAALGIKLTANSLIGRASRLRLEAPRRPTKYLAGYHAVKPPKHKVITSGGALTERLRRVRPAASRAPLTNSPAAAGEFLGLSILELDIGQCKYPEGDVSITFCAQPVAAGSPYCAHHTKLCYTGLR